MDIGLLGLALTLGLAANFFCAGACLPVLAPFIMGRTEGGRSGLSLGFWFAMGRLPLYLALGLIVAWTGDEVMEGQALGVTVAMRVVLAVAIMVYGGAEAFSIRLPHLCATPKGTNAFSLVLGALIGSIACPPLAILLAELFLEGDMATSIVAVLVFWAASSILILVSAGISGGAATALNRRWEEGKLREVMGWVLVMFGVVYLLSLGTLL
jgi:sulfite exporter TauE/SafE